MLLFRVVETRMSGCTLNRIVVWFVLITKVLMIVMTATTTTPVTNKMWRGDAIMYWGNGTKKIRQINNLSIVFNEKTMVYSVLTPDGNVLFTGPNLQDAVKRCESCKACVRRTRIDRMMPDGVNFLKHL